MSSGATDRQIHTVRTIAWCAEIVAPLSKVAREELLRHASTLLLSLDTTPTPDMRGDSREIPAHQGDLPPPAHTTDATVNSGPGPASDDAVGHTDKVADPAPSPPHPDPLPQAGEGTPAALLRWTDERKALLRQLWPTATTPEIVERLNALPGRPIAADQLRAYAQQVMRLPGRRVQRVAEPSAAAAEPSAAAAELAERARDDEAAPADYVTIRAWGAAIGVDVNGEGRSAEVVARVNAARRAHGLTPFRLVNRPIGALSELEHKLMRGAGAAVE